MTSDNHPTLTMPHSVRHSGRLVFPEYPNLIIKLPGSAVNILVTLLVAWLRTSHLRMDDRGWLNRQGLHATYQEQTGQKLTVDAVSKNLRRLMKRLRREFEDRGIEAPRLIQRDDRGTHLVRRMIIVDLTGKWQPPDETRSGAQQPGSTPPGQPFNVQQDNESTRQLGAD